MFETKFRKNMNTLFFCLFFSVRLSLSKSLLNTMELVGLAHSHAWIHFWLGHSRLCANRQQLNLAQEVVIAGGSSSGKWLIFSPAGGSIARWCHWPRHITCVTDVWCVFHELSVGAIQRIMAPGLHSGLHEIHRNQIIFSIKLSGKYEAKSTNSWERMVVCWFRIKQNGIC